MDFKKPKQNQIVWINIFVLYFIPKRQKIKIYHFTFRFFELLKKPAAASGEMRARDWKWQGDDVIRPWTSEHGSGFSPFCTPPRFRWPRRKVAAERRPPGGGGSKRSPSPGKPRPLSGRAGTRLLWRNKDRKLIFSRRLSSCFEMTCSWTWFRCKLDFVRVL